MKLIITSFLLLGAFFIQDPATLADDDDEIITIEVTPELMNYTEADEVPTNIIYTEPELVNYRPSGNDVSRSYENGRKNILEIEAGWRFGSTQELTDMDILLNKVYLEAKELKQISLNDTRFQPSQFMHHFTDTPDNTIYSILQRLPKGALLHSHLTSTHDLGSFPQLLLSLENCKICETEDDYQLHFYDDGVNDMSEEYTCRPCPSESDDAYPEELEMLRGKLSMYDGHDYSNDNIHNIWQKFQSKFGPTGNAKDTFHVWKAMLNSSLSLLCQDNIQYAEFRTGFGDWEKLVDRNGTAIPYDTVLEYLQSQIDLYRNLYPNFFGVNFVLTKSRGVGSSSETMKSKLEKADHYFQSSDLIRGFDLVGSEESGRTLKSALPMMLEWKKSSKSDMPFVFHTGETLWNGFGADENVLDAVMLDTKRIGHGFALDTHPYVLELVRSKGVGIELNPISNQVLGLVNDIRNHKNKRLMDVTHKPGMLSSNALKFSVSSDDCLIMGTRPMTDDLYMVIMAMSPRDSDLSVVKRLAYDSIDISLLTPEEKKHLTARFEKEWNHVVMELLLEELTGKLHSASTFEYQRREHKNNYADDDDLQTKEEKYDFVLTK